MTFVFLYNLTHSKTINYIKISFNQLLSFNQSITSFKISFDQLLNSFKISFNQLLFNNLEDKGITYQSA